MKRTAQGDPVALEFAVDKTDVKLVFAIELFNQYQFTLLELDHHRQTPAGERLFAGSQRLKRESGLAGQLAERLRHRFILEPRGAGLQRAGRTGNTIMGGDMAHCPRPVGQRRCGDALVARNVGVSHG